MHTCIQFGLNSAYRTGCSNNANINLEVGGNTVKTKKNTKGVNDKVFNQARNE
jgi:hypothetical protein